jgi:hypothetical protein
MAANMTGMRAEGTTVAGAAAKRGGVHGRGIGVLILAATILAAVLIAGTAMHDRQAAQPTAPAIPHIATRAETQFLANNTTNLPNAVTESGPVVATSSQQRFLEANTTTLPGAVMANVLAPITAQAQRFWEVNTMLPTGSMPYAEDVTPTTGHPR